MVFPQGIVLAKNRFINLDLNLLRTFVVLHQEKNARKAAERLFVSQPAISQALRKLRHHFDDELFVKVPNGLAPTVFSEELAGKIEPYLEGLSAVLSEVDEFDPKQLNQELSIALSPVHVFSLGSAIFLYFKTHAPNLRIKLLAWSDHSPRDIEVGDVYMGVIHDETQEIAQDIMAFPSLASTVLTQTYPAILVSKDHPLTKEPVTIENLAKYPLARLIVPGYNNIPKPPTISFFKQHGYDVSFGFSSEYPLVLLEVLERSDMFYVTSDCFPVAKYPSLRVLPIEHLNKNIKTNVSCYYHPRHRHSALTEWVSQSLQHIFQMGRIKNK
jgi:DNA-binding transcriptional LysR family regulator